MSTHQRLPAASAAHQPSESGPLVSLRLWLAGSPWRLSGGWLALAGLIAAAGPELGQGPWLPIALALALAEAFWGALWWQLVPAQAWPLHRAARRPALPYIQPGSPAGRLLGWQQPGAAAAITRAGAPLALLALLLALAISPLAVVLTGAVILLALLAMAARQAGLAGLVRWLYALVFAALPFALGVAVGLAGQWPSASQGPWFLTLAVGYTLLGRALAPDPQPAPRHGLMRLLTAAAGFGLAAATLLGSGLLLAGGAVGLLAVAPLLILARADDQPPAAAQPWTLAAILVSAAALGFGIG
ncbi:MAG TPA: hypothetical protein PKM78_05410 [Anaerolineae bacterium]|nr:hypothetical protein [Anaerolineae bacterium]HNU05420.1 hypothetical protein [Anaerolineae bacterium]